MKANGLNSKTLGLIALAAVALGGGAIYLQYNAMTDAEGRMKVLDAEVPEEEELIASLQEADQKIVSLNQELTHLEMGVPQIAYIPTLLEEIEKVGWSSQVNVTGVRPIIPPPPPAGVERERKAYEEVEIDITGKGDYQSFITLVDQLKRFPKIVAVQTVNLTPRMEANRPTYLHLDATLRLKAFVFPNNEEGMKTDMEIASAPMDGGNRS
ncbi:MAG: type 4a pilus biogenesis protein PilO [Fimbriimonadaceae bacterium]|nr:type 4a pilus biogenesis protein PilO [Fimbriimonadaceae bacterium]